MTTLHGSAFRSVVALCFTVTLALTAPASATVRVFMAPDGQQGSVPTTGNTMIQMDPGTTASVMVWIEDSVGASTCGPTQDAVCMFNGYQLIFLWNAQGSPGSTGLVSYANLPPFTAPDPGGNSVQVDKNNALWVFHNNPAAPFNPVNYNETKGVIFGAIYNFFFGSGITIGPGSVAAVPGGPNYIAQFQLQASPDACGMFEMRFNLPPKNPPLAAIFDPFGAQYPVDEWQSLTVEVVCKGGCQEPCDDLNACTIDDACVARQCVGTPVDCSDKGDQCNDAACDPAGAEGNCTLVPVEDGILCTDGNACTEDDACLNGNCVGPVVDCSELNDDCNTGECQPATGLCAQEPANEGLPCNDGSACTENETCSAGTCSGSDVDCSNLDDDCNDGVCLPATGLCDQEPTNEGLPCNGESGVCMAGDCVVAGECTSNDECIGSDIIACTVDTCDLAGGGICVHTPDDGQCADALDCTADTCSRATGCVNANTCPAETPFCTRAGCVECLTVLDCPDDVCTLNEACDSGQCTSQPVDCSQSGDNCNTASCDPDLAKSNCATLTPLANGTLCNGGLGVCKGGVCTPAGECQSDDMCDDGVECTDDSCNFTTGLCEFDPVNGACMDGLPCTMDICDPVTGCENDNTCPDLAPFCTAAGCVECLVDGDCDPAEVCTAGTCVPQGCTDDEECDDQLACTGFETCNPTSGECQAGDAVECDPGEVCTEPGGTCVAAPEGCFRTLFVKGGACPAPYNLSAQGVLPVVLAGDLDFAAEGIDLDSLELRRCDGVGGAAHPIQGPPGPSIEIGDERSPNDGEFSCADGAVCDCSDEQSSDGIADVKMKFSRPDVTEALQLGEFSQDDIIVVELSGVTVSGVSFCARDCIRIVGSGNGHRD